MNLHYGFHNLDRNNTGLFIMIIGIAGFSALAFSLTCGVYIVRYILDIRDRLWKIQGILSKEKSGGNPENPPS
jgi:hypothetical protein